MRVIGGQAVFVGSGMPAAPLLLGAGVLGAIVGSFLGAALERMPDGRSVLTGRSACDGCCKALTVGELVPVLSWLAQRGRCRACGSAIGGWQLGAELGAAGIAMLSVALAPPGQVLAAMLLGWQLLLLALLDARHLWLPRVLTGVLAFSGLVLAGARSWVLGDILPLALSGAGGALGFLMLWLVATGYRRARGRDGMGGGDPPLLGAIGVWIGPLGVIHVVLGASLLGIAAAVALFLAGRKLSGDSVLPLGTCLAAAAWPVFLWQGFA
ncbi:prepilin peptidase [Novosphingobium sp. KCTC 2891]|uniref:prepilin peptidase n=1 Tax=Novosphingobium sp. KCTC 2891 TaxID=2989730 RepID=UPI002222A09D|nr:A24 family peptidase [Novosphingobium sp. KCTC 2891]MCW1381727.1 prepilin peptidase [Novosphingobium sp. KCTC 2891]